MDQDDKQLQWALESVKKCQDADTLRRALVISLTHRHNFKAIEIASLVGRSESWVAKMRSQKFSSIGDLERNRHGGRRFQLLPAEEEERFMEHVCKVYAQRIRIWHRDPTQTRADKHIATTVKRELENRIGRTISRATAFNLMRRVGEVTFRPYYPSQWENYARWRY